jgi:hypothetical protein
MDTGWQKVCLGCGASRVFTGGKDGWSSEWAVCERCWSGAFVVLACGAPVKTSGGQEGGDGQKPSGRKGPTFTRQVAKSGIKPRQKGKR